jgi:hypothetical protein
MYSEWLAPIVSQRSEHHRTSTVFIALSVLLKLKHNYSHFWLKSSVTEILNLFRENIPYSLNPCFLYVTCMHAKWMQRAWQTRHRECLLVAQEIMGKSDVWNKFDKLRKINKKVRSKCCMHIMCAKQMLLDYNLISLTIWNNVNSKEIISVTESVV